MLPVDVDPGPEAASLDSQASDDVSVRAGADSSPRPGLQQRVEESRLGKRLISAIILVILGTQVVWSMPDSAIRQALMPVVEPLNAVNLNERWAMFAPVTGTRAWRFHVDVTMADGSTRVWSHRPDGLLEKILMPDRWQPLMEMATRQPDGRKEFARWVVDTVTEPSERPVKVAVLYDFKALAPPGQPSKAPFSTKVLYEEVLTGPR